MTELASGDNPGGFKLESLWPQSSGCLHILRLLPQSTPRVGPPGSGMGTGLASVGKYSGKRRSQLCLEHTHPPPLPTPPASRGLELSVKISPPPACLSRPHVMWTGRLSKPREGGCPSMHEASCAIPRGCRPSPLSAIATTPPSPPQHHGGSEPASVLGNEQGAFCASFMSISTTPLDVRQRPSSFLLYGERNRGPEKSSSAPGHSAGTRQGRGPSSGLPLHSPSTEP